MCTIYGRFSVWFLSPGGSYLPAYTVGYIFVSQSPLSADILPNCSVQWVPAIILFWFLSGIVFDPWQNYLNTIDRALSTTRV